MGLLELQNQIDVLVVGGGTAGTIAAIASARQGASTLLLEANSQLGGVTTTGGVNFPGLFHAWGKQIIAGVGWELVTKTVELAGGSLPDFSTIPPRHWHHQVRLNAPLYAALAEEACVQAGVQLCYYETPIQVIENPSQDGYAVTSIGKGVRRTIQCKQIVDCTGGAEVVNLLGLPRLREDEIQPGTMMYRIEGYDVTSLDKAIIQQRYQEALAAGDLQPGDSSYKDGPFLGVLHAHGENTQHVFDADNATAAAHTDANIRGRASVLRLIRFIRTLPGCENTQLVRMCTETAVRETYRIKGRVIITCDDYVQGRFFDDAMSYSFYPIDLHTHEGVKPEPLSPGVVPTIPLGALSPADSRNLLVAGRCVSSDRLANSALRVQASCMGMGQVAGTAAALASQAQCDPMSLDLHQLRTCLSESGAIVPTKAAFNPQPVPQPQQV